MSKLLYVLRFYFKLKLCLRRLIIIILFRNFLGSLRRTAMAWLQAQTQGGAEEPPPPDENPEPHENGQP